MQKQEYTLQEYTEEELEKFAEEKLDNLTAAGCCTFNILTGGAGIALIVVLGLIAAGYLYLKFFRGSATKLFSKVKGLRK